MTNADPPTPHEELNQNTTWDLVAYIEKLRIHLGIKNFTVFGGSWGSTLALTYSQTHPESCNGIILRGIFLVRQKEIHWFYQQGASNIFTDAWEEYLKPIPEAERDHLVAAYYKRLTSENLATRLEAAKAWSIWEASTSKLIQDPQLMAKFGDGHFADAFARID